MSTQTSDTELKELLEKFSRNSIVLDISEEVPITKGWTRFGGQPDVPPDFEWLSSAMTFFQGKRNETFPERFTIVS